MFEVLRPTRKCFPHGDILVLSPLHIMSSATIHAGTGRAYCLPKTYRRDEIFTLHI